MLAERAFPAHRPKVAMMVDRHNDDFEPVAWARGIPLGLTALLVLAHLVFALLAVAFREWPGLMEFAFSSEASLRGALWQWVTYPFLHLEVMSQLNPILFAIELLLFFSFGREVERYLGKRRFLALYALLALVPALVLTLLGPLMPSLLYGSRDLHFGIFIAFATLYPGVEFFFGLRAKWVAIGLVGFFGLFSLAQGGAAGYTALTTLLVDTAVAWALVQHLRGALELPRIPSFLPKRRKTPQRPPHHPPRETPTEEDPMSAIDPLLDKINQEGIKSLTPAERHRLAEARERLLNRPK